MLKLILPLSDKITSGLPNELFVISISKKDSFSLKPFPKDFATASFALNLAAMGYDILIGYNKSKQEAENLAQKIRQDFAVKCETFQCDLQDVQQTKKLAEFAKENFEENPKSIITFGLYSSITLKTRLRQVIISSLVNRISLNP